MPVMDLFPNDALNFHAVFSYMVHPDSEKHRHEYLAVLLLQAVAEAGGDQNDAEPVAIPPLLLKTAINAPSFEEVKKRAANTCGYVAGDVLLYITQFVCMGHEGSVRKARAILAEEYAQTTDHEGKKLIGARQVATTWNHFKSVAHLWAAFRALSQGECKTLEAFAELDIKETIRNFVFVSHTICFLTAGETYGEERCGGIQP